jgi:hypothetical protein
LLRIFFRASLAFRALSLQSSISITAFLRSFLVSKKPWISAGEKIDLGSLKAKSAVSYRISECERPVLDEEFGTDVAISLEGGKDVVLGVVNRLGSLVGMQFVDPFDMAPFA